MGWPGPIEKSKGLGGPDWPRAVDKCEGWGAGLALADPAGPPSLAKPQVLSRKHPTTSRKNGVKENEAKHALETPDTGQHRTS